MVQPNGGADKIDETNHRPILGPPFGACGRGETSRLCWICNLAVLGIGIYNPFFRIANDIRYRRIANPTKRGD